MKVSIVDGLKVLGLATELGPYFPYTPYTPYTVTPKTLDPRPQTLYPLDLLPPDPHSPS